MKARLASARAAAATPQFLKGMLLHFSPGCSPRAQRVQEHRADVAIIDLHMTAGVQPRNIESAAGACCKCAKRRGGFCSVK